MRPRSSDRPGALKNCCRGGCWRMYRLTITSISSPPTPRRITYTMLSQLRTVARLTPLRTFSTARTLLNASATSPSNNETSQNKDTSISNDAHINFLRKYYPEELVESIKLAETFIKSEDFENRKLASTEFAPPYLDDFSKRHPFWDTLKVDEPWKLDHEYPLQPSPTDLPPGATMEDAGAGDANSSIAKGLAALTGLDERYIEKLQSRPLIMKRVSNQTAKGKIPTNYALVVVGDKNGMVGIGEGKDRVEMSRAVSKAHWNAVKNLQYVPLYENRTIVGNIDYVFHGCKIFLRSAPPGFGLRVNHFIFEICELAGIKDLSAKIYKSRNGMNVCKGFVEALTKQQTLEELSLNRGKKIVDLRKTYYSA